MLLVIVGQAMAVSVVPCKMDMHSQPGSKTMDVMNHSAHIMSADTDIFETSGDCCDQDYRCSMINCSMVSSVSVVLSPAPYFDSEMISSQEIGQSQSWAISQTPTSLYRPPIYR